MEAGNPKQVAVLSVVAVAAIGFLLTKMHGKALPGVAKAMVDSATGHHSPSLSFPLVTDPFSHPKLAPPKDPTLQTSTSVDPVEAKIPKVLSGHLPAAGNSSSDIFAGSAATTPGDSSSTTTGPIHPPEPSKTPEGTEVVLEGTAGASDAVAFLAIGGAESQPFHAHDSIKGKVRLLRVEDGAVVLSGPKGELTLSVGERKRI